MEKPHAFLTLDALRGIAAIAVMEFHTFRFFGAQIFPHGYLAVDFFFMLSGFVLTFAYQQRLDDGWRTVSFFRTRLIRLYPLYLLGLTLGCVFSALQSQYGRAHLAPASIVVLFILGMLLLPAPPAYQAGGTATFPFDVPAWSLFNEIVANLLHALLMRRRGNGFLATVILVSLAVFILLSIRLNTMNVGVYRTEIPYGLVRVIFSYTMGIALFRISKGGWVKIRIPAFLPALLLLSALALPDRPASTVIIDLVLVVCVFPLLILASATAHLPNWLVRPSHLLGTASYAIYVLHVPIGEVFEQVWSRLRHHRIELDAPWPGLIYIAFTILFALVIDRVYDVKARLFLRRRFERTSPPVSSFSENREQFEVR